MTRGRRSSKQVWTARRKRLVASLTFLLLVLVVSTQSATAEQLTPGRLPFSSVVHWFKDLMASAPVAPEQQFGQSATASVTRAGVGAGHAAGTGSGQQAAATASAASKQAAGKSAGVHRGFDAKTSVFLASKSTALTSWWQNADGTQTERLSAAPANYHTAQGTWAPIDTTLVRGSDGLLHEKANSFGLTLGANTSATSAKTASLAKAAVQARDSSVGSDSTGELATLTYGTGESFGWELSGAAAVAPTTSENTVSYPAILQDTELDLTSESWGVKESLVLSAADAPSAWTFPLTETGLTLGQSSGVWQLTDSTGAVVATLPAPYAVDANGVRTSNVTYSLATVSGVPELTMALDSAWLADSTRAFPVTVDPTVSNPGTETSAMISYANPNTNYGTYAGMGVGETQINSTTLDIQRAYVAYPTGVANTGYHITAAGWTGFMTSGSTASTDPFSIYSVGSPWSASTITAANAPTSYVSKLGTYSGLVVSSTSCNGVSGNWVGVTLDANAMSQFATNTYGWNGIWLQADSESSTAYYRVFNTTQVSSCSPYLNLTYTPDTAPTLSSMSPASETPVSSLTPELTATGTDPDSWPDSAVKYEFYVYSGNGGAPIAKSSLLSTGSWSIPAGTLKWNNTYQWNVCVWDGWECQSTSLTTNTFSTNAPAPMLTQDLSQATDGHGFNAQSGNYTSSATDADVAGIGPSLSVVRDYNSLDNRAGEGFGEGWSSLADATVTQGLDTTGALVEAGVTYPDGSVVAFGYSGGSYTPPEGRYATLSATKNSSGTVTAYTLTDKSGTTYTFGAVITAPGGGVPGVFGLSQVTDHQGRALDVTWQTVTLSHTVTQAGALQGTQTGGFYRVGTITNETTNRALTFEWSWPNEVTGQSTGNTGITQPHVSEVITSDAKSLDDTTHQVWTYGYTGNELTSVCAPSQSAPATASSACTGYSYQNGSVYRTAVLDGSPYQFWPMSDVSSATSNYTQSLVGANVGVGTAWYEHLTADTSSTPGPMTPVGSNETGAVFNGSTGYMSLPSGMIVNTTYVSVGLWFKTSGGGTGPLFCEQNQPLGGATAPTTSTCSLYVGTDGKLHGAWYNGSTTPITSSSIVNDNKWHFVLLSGEGSTQSLYLDGSLVGTLPSHTVQNLAQTYEYVGGGYSSASWPDTTSAAGNWYFTGSIADVAVYKQGVPAAEVSSLYTAATVPSAQLTQVTRPDLAANASEKPAATVTYDAGTGRVSTVTDANGATWTLSAPGVNGSSQVFASDVLGLQPADYYRFNDSANSTYPVDQVNADAWANAQLAGQYNDVGLGSTASVFGDGTDVGVFTPTSSYTTSSWVQLPNSLEASAPASIAMWFNAPKGKSGPLYCMQSSPLSATPTNATCPLYVGTNGNLYGGFYMGSYSNIASAHAVNDGNWHYVVLTATSSSESLYLDGSLVGTSSGTFNASGQIVNYVGGGYSSTDWPNTGDKGDWLYSGDISDVAIYRSALTQAQATSLWQGYENTVGSVVPLETVTVTDPLHTGGATGTVTGSSTAGVETYAYDPAHGGREVSYTDPLGGRSTDSYDVNGFLYAATDANGDQTITGRDARGNVVSTTTCQLQSQGKCQTSYATYYWSVKGLASTTTDVDADFKMTASDGRSSSASDTTYQTTYNPDNNGNVLTTADPDGDKTTNTYTGSSNTLACDPGPNAPGSTVALGTKSTTQYAPVGLLNQTTTAGGAITSYWYYPDGDTCEVKDADGLDTIFTYDLLGRVTSKTVTGDPAVPAASLEQYTESLTTTYSYDGDGRVIETDAPAVTDRVTGAEHTAITTQVFDADGNVTCTSVADSTGGDATRTTTYAYNNYDQKVSETAPEGNSATACTGNVIPDELDGQNHTTTYTYDLFGNVLTQTDPQNRATQYLYDADNRLVTTEELNTSTDGTSASGSTLVTDSRTYDAGGRLAEETTGGWLQGTTSGAEHATCYLYYDDDLTAEVTKINTSVITACPTSESQATADSADGTEAFIQAQDTYDNAGNLTASVTNNGETTTDYAFDNAGRKKSTTLDPSGLDRVTTDTYSADGYLTEAKLTAPGATGTVVADVSATYTPMGEQWTQSVVNGSSTLTTTTKRDERGLPYMSTDANGNVTYTTYDEAGRLAVTQSPQVSATTYSTATMSATTNTPAYAITSTGYDTFGETVETEAANAPDAGTSTTGATADSTVYTYDADGNQTSVTRPSYIASSGPSLQTSTTVVKYDGDGEVTETVDPIAYNSYVASGTAATFSAGEVTTSNYNQFGEVSTATATDYNNAGATATTSSTYYPDETTASTTGPTGAVTRQTYDYLGRTATSTQVERTRTDGTSGTADYTADYSYGAGGWVSEVQSPDNVATSGQGTAVSYAYNAAGETTQVTDAAGDKTQYAYDAAGRTVKTTQPDGSYTTTTYDEAGRATDTAAYNAGAVEQTWTQNLYDNDGSLLCAEKPVPGTTTANLPAAPSATTITTSNYTSACVASTSYDLTQFQYDPTGLITKEIQPVSASSSTSSSITVSYGYDLNGDQTAYTDGNGNASGNAAANTTYNAYNAWQQPETTIEPTSATYTGNTDRETTTTYNADGSPTQVAEPGGVTLDYSYYGNGQLAQETGTGATATTATRAFTYYSNGSLETATTSNTLNATASASSTSTASASNATSESYTYDDRGNLVTTSGSAGSSSFDYNGDGLVTSAGNTVGSTAQTTSYTYDDVDRLSTLKDAATGTSLTYAYTPSSDKQTVTYGTSGDVRTLQYNTLGELTSDTLATTTGTSVQALSYGYDVDGNLTSKTDSSGTANAYTYDQAGRLTSWTKGSSTNAYSGTGTCTTSSTLTCYAYDADSNRTRVGSNVYTYDSRDELTSDGLTSYSYSANGNLSGKTSSSGTTTYTDDAYGQQATAGVEEYTYDASGRMISETNPGSGGTTTTLTYEGTGNEVASDGTNSYTRTPSGSLIGATTATGSTLIWTDAHTDVVGTFSPTSSSLTGTENYDPLGNELTDTGTAKSLTVGYQSEYTDSATGEVNMAARWYNPATGQFLNKDTASNSATPNTANANPFAYANGNPLVGTDPSGHAADFCVTLACAQQTYGGTSCVDCNSQKINDYKRNDNGSLTDSSTPTVPAPAPRPTAARAAATAQANARPKTSNPKDGSAPKGEHWEECTEFMSLHGNGCALGSSYLASDYVPPMPGLFNDFINLAMVVGAVVVIGLSCTAGGALTLGASCIGAVAATGCALAVQGGCLSGAEGGEGGATDDPAASGSLDSNTESVGSDTNPSVGQDTDPFGSASADPSSSANTDPVYGPKAPDDSGKSAAPAAPHAPDSGTTVNKPSANDLPEAQTVDAVHPAPAEAVKAAVTKPAAPDAAPVEATPEETTAPTAGTEPKRAPSCHSFAGSTGVLMADGTVEPIDQIQLGDKIADAIPGQDTTLANTVTAVIVTHTDHDFVDLTIAPEPTSPTGKTATTAKTTASATSKAASKLSAGKKLANGLTAAATVIAGASATPAAHAVQHGGTLTTTYHHPFYDITQQAFVDAQYLKVGDELQTTTGRAEVASIRLYHADTTTYDLTIGELHTFYVVAGGTPVLVHNCDIDTHSSKCTCENGDPPRIPRNPAGRRGNAATQAQLNDVRDEFLAANPDWVHYAGGTDAVTGDALPEETIFGPNGERRFPDLSFRLPDGSSFYVNTVDTISDGVTADPRELANAIDINMWGQGPVAMIPKSR